MSQYNYKLEIDKSFNISKYNIITSKNNPYFLLSLGFNVYYSNNIQKFIDYKKRFKGKKKIYNIINPYQYKIDEYDDGIYNKAIIKFKKIDDKILNNQDFYKLWEINKVFKILNKSDNVLCFDEISKNICENIGCNTKLNNFDDNIKDEFDIIINSNINKIAQFQEQEYINTFIKIIKSLHNLKSNGSIIFKISNIFTSINIQLIYLIINSFKTSNIYIPLTSQLYKSEKYLICSGYKENKNILKLINELNKIIDDKIKIIDIGLNINDEFKNTIIKLNIELMVQQAKLINILTSYIDKQNYYGEEYNIFLKDQKEKNKEWITNYF
jgi:hypothetical protein